MSNIVLEAARASSDFERMNNEAKKLYLMRNIDKINSVMRSAPGFCGSFGTGYPFYAIGSNLDGELPIIEEQLRYNNELEAHACGINGWTCEECLQKDGCTMPDLKQVCKPCPNQKDELKPRKVVNRLPDIDMWMICEDGKVEEAKAYLSREFDYFDMHTSDVDPVKTIGEIKEIVSDLSHSNMPRKYLPLDIHVIERSKIANLLMSVPFCLLDSIATDKVPYLPIHPQSLRKTWQYDDVAYNFVLDYMYSLTPFDWDRDLQTKLLLSRRMVAGSFDEEQIRYILEQVSPDSVKRRFETPTLQLQYKERVKSWKR